MFLLLASPAFASGFLVSPSAVFATVPAGGEIARSLSITAADGRSTRVHVSVEPFVLDEEGKPDHGPGRAPAESRFARLEVRPRTVVLREGSPQSVEIRCAPPVGAAGSQWAVILLDLEPVRLGGQRRAPADVIGRLAVPVFVTVEGTEKRELRIERITAERVEPDTIQVAALLENRGNTILRASGGWTAESQGRELAWEELKDVLLLPGFRRRVGGFVAVAGGLRHAGRLSAHLWIRFGAGAAEVVEADCGVPAP